jgi:hypothetical protein
MGQDFGAKITVRLVADRAVESSRNKPLFKLGRFRSPVLEAKRNLANIMSTAPEREPVRASWFIQAEAVSQPLANLRAKHGFPEFGGNGSHIYQVARNWVVFVRPSFAAKFGPERELGERSHE